MDAAFRTLLERARAGDEPAIAELLGRYEPEVRMTVRARLPRALRSQFDSMDFVQAVWKSVLADNDGAGAVSFDDAARFRDFLAGVARNKVLQEYRKRTRTHKYNLAREEPLYVRRAGRDLPRDLPAPDATPSEEVQALDCWEKLISGSAEEAEVVGLRRRGLTFEEIAAKTGRSERGVRRLIDAIRERFEEARRCP